MPLPLSPPVLPQLARPGAELPDGDGWALSFNYTRNLQLPFNRPLVPTADARLTGEAAARGIACQGPFPADTVFIKGFGNDFDGVLSMYHDQGQIATKMKGFNRGVTVTGGLKTVFATPAHGTAFDIVGKGVATTGALEQAVRLAARLASHRKGT